MASPDTALQFEVACGVVTDSMRCPSTPEGCHVSLECSLLLSALYRVKALPKSKAEAAFNEMMENCDNCAHPDSHKLTRGTIKDAISKLV